MKLTYFNTNFSIVQTILMIIASIMVVEIISLILKNHLKEQKPYLNKVTPYDLSIQNLNANLIAQFDNNNNLSNILTDFGIYDTTFNLNPETDYGSANTSYDNKLTDLSYGDIKQLNPTSENNQPVSNVPDTKITDTTINLNPQIDYDNVDTSFDNKLTDLPYGDIKQLNPTSENNEPVVIDPDTKITDTTINLNPQISYNNVDTSFDTNIKTLSFNSIKDLNAVSENNEPVVIDPDTKITDTTINLNPQISYNNVDTSFDTNIKTLSFNSIKDLNAVSQNNEPVVIDGYTYDKTAIDFINKVSTSTRPQGGTSVVDG